MEFLRKIANTAQRKLITRQEKKTDSLLGILHAIAKFEELLDAPSSADIEVPTGTDIPSSRRYNDTIQKIMDDMNTIREHQQSIINNLLISWNESEQVIPVDVSTIVIDKQFPLFSSPAKTNGHITLNAKSVRSAIPELKTLPILTATSSESSIIPVYGKSYGLFINGNESGEDGIRPDINDGGKIIDGRDSFWEAEAVTLQEDMPEDVFTPQSTTSKEISLTVNITLTFRNPLNINFFTIDPHTFAQSTYFDITAINVISSTKTVPVLTSPITITGKTRITFNTIIANALQISIRQNKGYFQKYHLAKYMIGNNNSWIDFTGPELIKRVGADQSDINKTIREEVLNAGEWIPSIWIPDSPANEVAILDPLSGDSGYRRIESTESRRKRWAIGIQEIEFGEEVYDDLSEVVSLPYDMPDETTSVYLIVDDEEPSGTEITYMLSFDDGASWNEITPINKMAKSLTSGYILPQRIFINSDISRTRKENTLTGVNGFVNTPNRKVRVRAILKKDTSTSNSPRILSFSPEFDTAVPII